MKRVVALLVLVLLAVVPAQRAEAFCGFYIGGADAELFNDATVVVMMREGTRTVLSMQNSYSGPPDDFAMVIPVPVVLSEENVRTLKPELFEHVDKLAAPRLVEYWEQDPCPSPKEEEGDWEDDDGAPRRMGAKKVKGPKGSAAAVTVEAEFTVGEYEIVILSAKDSMGLDTWIRQNGYNIPAGAEPFMRPYVQMGSKFFVARVNADKVKLEDGQAMLSPLRFHYDSDTFSLPVRLGLMNSSGTQDLLVHILARGQRYEVANLANVTIPTNLDVDPEARKQFGAFYASLFDATLERNPGAVITEYAWDAGTCDPCPTPSLNNQELALLGADVLPQAESQRPKDWDGGKEGRVWVPPWNFTRGFVLTRLHLRYSKASLTDDLIFRAAAPIEGGREHTQGADGELEVGAQFGGVNNFQGRYAIRHKWTGPIECDNPVRGIWGGPPSDLDRATEVAAATESAFAPRGAVKLASMLPESTVDGTLKTAVKLSSATPGLRMLPEPEPPKEDPVLQTPAPAAQQGGCAGCSLASPTERHRSVLAMSILAAAIVLRRTRRKHAA